jgi:predicted RND superfamily exporter protein
MSWKRYRNELIVLAVLLLFIGAFFYKQGRESAALEGAKQIRQELSEVRRLVDLKKIWGSSKITQKVGQLKQAVPPAKVTWQKKAKKLHATFSDLTAREVNTVVTKILNLPVEIKELKIDKNGRSYQVECRCKW